MELTIRENEVISQLPATFQRIVSAKFKKPIKDYKDRDLELEINHIVTVAFSEMGIKSDDKVSTFLCETLLKDLKQAKYATITIEEIKLFISNGIRGEYGSFNGQLNTINIQNIHHWIKSGLGSRDREMALKEFNRLNVQQDAPKLSYSEIRRIEVEAVKERFKHYKETGDIGYFAFASYNTLCDLVGVYIPHAEKGRIKTLISDENTRKLAYLEAKKEHQHQYDKELSKARFKQNHSKASEIEGLMKNMFSSDNFEQLLKKKYLIYYFDSIEKLDI